MWIENYLDNFIRTEQIVLYYLIFIVQLNAQ